MYEKLLKELCKVLPRCVLIIERNSIGDGIIDHLYYSEVLPRLYFDKSLDLVKDKLTSNETVESMLKKNASMKSYYGVYTSNQSREDMMAILARHVAEYKEKFVTHNVIRDLSRLIRKSNGKVEAGAGYELVVSINLFNCWELLTQRERQSAAKTYRNISKVQRLSKA